MLSLYCQHGWDRTSQVAALAQVSGFFNLTSFISAKTFLNNSIRTSSLVMYDDAWRSYY